MTSADDIVRRARSIFGDRLRGIFAFGSRVAGGARRDSDLDLGVWLEGRSAGAIRGCPAGAPRRDPTRRRPRPLPPELFMGLPYYAVEPS